MRSSSSNFRWRWQPLMHIKAGIVGWLCGQRPYFKHFSYVVAGVLSKTCGTHQTPLSSSRPQFALCSMAVATAEARNSKLWFAPRCEHPTTVCWHWLSEGWQRLGHDMEYWFWQLFRSQKHQMEPAWSFCDHRYYMSSRYFFCQSWGRLNVALTRAKQILLVVGHEQTQCYWVEIGCEWIVTVL